MNDNQKNSNAFSFFMFLAFIGFFAYMIISEQDDVSSEVETNVNYNIETNVNSNIEINNELYVDNKQSSIDFSNIPEPIQIKTSGETVIDIGDYEAELTFLAEYTVCGRVVDVENYPVVNFAGKAEIIRNTLSPLDLALSWGFLARDESEEKIKWSSNGNRFIRWTVTDTAWYDRIGREPAITSCCSNNHIIPANREIGREIKRINRNDYVKITGYLVNVYVKLDDSGGYFYWNSSTSRNDNGDGACEIIYVTDVEILK